MKNVQAGFTLIEIMIVVVIIGIMAAIAVPNYSEYVKRGNRTEGQALLSDASARQERYFSQNNAYITASGDIAKLGLRGGDKSETGKYTLTVSKVDEDGGYTLTAEQNFDDSKCGDLTLDARGRKGNSGSESTQDCWR
ncbi:MAG: type IV pilin protein [Pseudomonas sp.]|uniref:type IV pilin protein n=1 Tax=Pseudomonas sp. TaxID=306 RepID=UPI003D130C0E